MGLGAIGGLVMILLSYSVIQLSNGRCMLSSRFHFVTSFKTGSVYPCMGKLVSTGIIAATVIIV